MHKEYAENLEFQLAQLRKERQTMLDALEYIATSYPETGEGAVLSGIAREAINKAANS